MNAEARSAEELNASVSEKRLEYLTRLKNWEESTRAELEANADNYHLLSQLSWIQSASGRGEEAILTSARAVAVSPGPRSLNQLARIEFAAGKADDAMKTIAKARDQARWDHELLTALVQTLVRYGKTDQATAVARSIVDRDIKDPTDLAFIAQYFAEAGMDDNAIAAIRKAIDLEPAQVSHVVDLILLKNEADQFVECKDIAARNLDQLVKSPAELMRLISGLDGGKGVKEIVAIVRASIAGKLRDMEYRQLAFELIRPEAADDSLNFSREFIKANGADEDLPSQVAGRWIAAGFLNQGREFSDEAIRRSKGWRSSLTQLAKQWVAAGQSQSAIAMIRQIAGRPKSDSRISSESRLELIDLTVGLFASGKIDDAVVFSRELWKAESDNPLSTAAMGRVALEMLRKEQWSQAESLLRECLTIRESEIPDDWMTFSAQSMLGESLLGQKLYDSAEPLLISGYEGIQSRADKMEPSLRIHHLQLTGERIVRLYTAWEKPNKVADWREKLISDLDKARKADVIK
jgi:Flp pilus assembly protein TadD